MCAQYSYFDHFEIIEKYGFRTGRWGGIEQHLALMSPSEDNR